jgi:UDP-2-acetamido-2,6-beta-L-arabino-hexul-4-ose reductase
MDWDKPFEVIKLTPHSDERGTLFEIIRFKDFDIPCGGQIYTFSIMPGKRRGDHYHLHKMEWFTCAFGEAIILLTTMDGINTAYKISDKDPKLIFAGPGTSHALINTGPIPAIIVSYGSTQHSEEDPDTFSFKAYPNFDIAILEK